MFTIYCLFLVLSAIEKEMENTQNTLTLHQMQQVSERCDVTLVSSDGEQFIRHTWLRPYSDKAT